MQKDKSNGNVPNSAEGSDGESEFVETDPTGRYGRYKEILGKGAFKTVYRAFDEFEGIEVAWNQVKLQDLLHSPEDLERLYSEVHLLRSLKHKNIMKFYGSWVDTKANNLNFITEMFTSGTLRQFRRKHKRVNLRAVKNWSRQILRGLLYLHSHDPPIIHRDLKCDNIFVNGHQGEVKIGDFGLAAILRQAHAAHSVIGTPEFMAPELYEEEYNELVDIYAFGMCVLEMVTFEYPYSECKNAAQIYKKVTSGQKPAALQKVKNLEVRAFVEKCLATVSKRLPARELLNDSFLQCHDLGRKSWVDGTREELVENTNSSCSDVCESVKSKEHVDFRDGQSGKFGSLKADRLLGESHALHSCVEDSSFIRKLPEMMPDSGECLKRSKEFQVRGKRGSDDAILLKLRIADHEGNRRNIQFHFDVEADTAMSVASEMVAELDLSDHDVTTIAEMIDAEMMALIPDWIPGGSFDETSQLDNSETHYVADAGNWYSEMISKTLPKVHLGSHTEGQGTMHGRFEELAYNSCQSPFFGRSNEHSLLSSGSSEVKEESDEWEIDRLINADHEMSLERRSYGHHYDQVGEARKYCGDFFTAGQQERAKTADRQFFPWTNEGRSSGSSNQDDAQLKTLAYRQEMELQELKKKHQQALDELSRRRYRSSVNNYSYNHNQESSEDIYCRSGAHDIYCRSEAHMQSEVDSDGVLRARNAEQRRMSLNDIFPNVGKLKTRDDSWQMKQEHFVSAPVTPKQFVREVLGPLRAEDALVLAMQMGTHSPSMKCHDARTRDQVSDIPSKGPSLVASNSYSEVGQIACARSYDDMQRSNMSSRFNQANESSEGDDFDFHAKQPRRLFGNESFIYGSDGSCNLNMKQMKADIPGLWQQPQVCERDLQEKRKDDYSGAMRCQQSDSIQIRQGYSTKSENGEDVQFQEKSNSRKLEGALPGKLEHAKSENALFLEQFRKEQLHKSIADLESKTLQKLYNSANVHCGGMKQNLASQRRSSISDLKRQALAQVSL